MPGPEKKLLKSVAPYRRLPSEINAEGHAPSPEPLNWQMTLEVAPFVLTEHIVPLLLIPPLSVVVNNVWPDKVRVPAGPFEKL